MSGRIEEMMKPKELQPGEDKEVAGKLLAVHDGIVKNYDSVKNLRVSSDLSIASTIEEENCAVTVAVRVRPFANRESEHPRNQRIVFIEENETIVRPNHTSSHAVGEHRFQYDHCFNSFNPRQPDYSTQQNVYELLAQPLLTRAYQGYNTCLFAYGQTGSGKSYCIMGHGEDEGIIPRFSKDLFQQSQNIINTEPDVVSVTVETSFFEIYNEKIHDLLSTTGLNSNTNGRNSQTKQNLKVREHPDLGPYVEGLSTYPVSNYQDISGLLTIGNRQRATASTGMNDKSSRSHSVFTIVLTQTKSLEFEDQIHTHTVTSRINLIDLAGSERQSTAQTSGIRLKEGASINRSLLTLGKVICILAESSSNNRKKKLFVPYRDSVLTYLLKQSLGGNAKTAMIATISPSSLNMEETLSTLRYAQKARSIINAATVNEDPKARLIRELREEIERLKAGQNGQEFSSSLHEIAALRIALKDKEADMEEKTSEWQQQVKQAEKKLHEQMTQLQKTGVQVLDNAIPHLVNLNEDPQLNEILLYRLNEGLTRIGRSHNNIECEIQLSGALVADHHCQIMNESGHVTITPIDKEAPTFLNGEQINRTYELNHGDRVVLGGDHYFRFSFPSSIHSSKRVSTSKPKDFLFARTEIETVQNKRLEAERAELEAEIKTEMLEKLKSQQSDYQKRLQQQKDEYENKIHNLQTDMLRARNSRPLISPAPEISSASTLISNLMAEKERLQKWAPKRKTAADREQEAAPRSNAAVPTERCKTDLYKVTLLIREANKLSQLMNMPSVFTQEEVDNVIVIKVNDSSLNQSTFLTVSKFEERLTDMREAFSGEESPDESISLFCNPNDVWRSNNNQQNNTRLDEIINNENHTSCIEQLVRTPSPYASRTNGTTTASRRKLYKRAHSNNNYSILSICKDFASFSMQKYRQAGQAEARTVFDQILRQCELIKKSHANLLQTLTHVTVGDMSIAEFESDETTGAACFQLACSSEVLLAQCQLCNSMCEELSNRHINNTVNRMCELSQKISRQIVILMQALSSGVERSVHDCSSSLLSATFELCKSCGVMSLITDTNVSMYAEHFIQLSTEVQSMCSRGSLEQLIHTCEDKLNNLNNTHTTFKQGARSSFAADIIYESVGKVLKYLEAFILDYKEHSVKILNQPVDDKCDHAQRYESCAAAVVILNQIGDHVNTLTKPMFTQGKEYDRAIMLKGADSIKRCCRKLASDTVLNLTPLEDSVRHLFCVTEAEGKVKVKHKMNGESRTKRILPQIGSPEKTRRLLPATPTSTSNHKSIRDIKSPETPPKTVENLRALFNGHSAHQ